MAATGIVGAEYFSIHPRTLLALLLCALPILIWRPVSVFIWIYVGLAFYTLHSLNHGLNPGLILWMNLGREPQTVQAAGIVVDEPAKNNVSHGVRHSRFKVRLEHLQCAAADAPCAATVLVDWAGTVPAYGDRVEFTGTAQEIPGPRNPGQMDFAGYLKRLGIYSEIRVRYASEGAITGHGQGNFWVDWAAASRRWMQSKLALDLEDSPEIAGLIQSLVLGLKDQTPEETRELFRRTGTLHLFVVNGLHIGMLALIAQLLLRPVGINRRRSFFLVIPLLIFYTLATGLNPGSIRATLMAAVLLAGQFFERQPFSFNTLGAAAFAILAWDTNQLFMPGFQFSFGVVFAILLLAGRFRRFFLGLGRPDLFLPRSLWSPFQEIGYFASQHLAGLLSLSLAAWIGSLPFTLRFFHLLSPGAALANLVLVPLAFVVLAQGILALLAASASTAISILFNNSNWAVAHLLLFAVRFFAQIPGSHFYVAAPSLHPPDCEMTVFDFKNGGCIFLESKHRDWLIDAGSAEACRNTMRPFLQMHGVNRLDGLILTRGASGSIGGAIPILLDFRPRAIVDSTVRDHSPAHAAFIATLSQMGREKTLVEPADRLSLAEGVTARVLYPPPGLKVRVLDDKAMVLQIEAGQLRILLMSGAGFLTERWLLENEPDLKSDILIKGRHPSDLSGTRDFIAAVQPRVIVCASAGFASKTTGDEAWMHDYQAQEIEWFAQDSTGAVQIEMDADQYRVKAFLGNQIFLSNNR